MRCRSIDEEVRKESELPPVRNVWTVEKKLGGWDAAQAKYALTRAFMFVQ